MTKKYVKSFSSSEIELIKRLQAVINLKKHEKLNDEMINEIQRLQGHLGLNSEDIEIVPFVHHVNVYWSA